MLNFPRLAAFSVLILVFTSIPAGDTLAQSAISFRDATAGSGIDTSIGGVGVSTFDFNDDGYDDLTLALRDSRPALLQNNGDGTFTDISLEAGITSVGIMMVTVWVDVNRDGLPDLFIGQASLGANALWLNQGDGTFIEVADAWGLDTKARVGGVTFGDFSGDGYPDLFMGVENGFDLLYRNTGGTGFEDVTEAYGVAGKPFSIPMQPTWIDIDEDGDRDLFVMHDEDEYNFLYLNSDGASFTENAAAWGIRQVGVGSSMGVAWGDPDMDGDMDAYVTRIGVAGLYIFDQRVERFVDQATQWRVTLNGVGWGTYFADLDNDGDEDLPLVHSSRAPGFEPPILFENLRSWFEPVYQAGDFVMERSDHGLAVGDFNADGRQDLVVVNTRGEHRLLINDTPEAGNWITVRLMEADSYPGAIGARLEMYVGDDTLVRVLHAGDGYNGQNTYRMHFGLGQATQADSLRVRWPDGQWESFGALQANNRYQILDSNRVTEVEQTVRNPELPDLEVWPNPVEDWVTFRLVGGGKGPSEIVIRDVLGRTVFQQEVDGTIHRMDMSGYAAGLYTLTARNESGIWRAMIHRR